MRLTHSAIAAMASAPFHGWLAWAVTPVIVTSNHVRPLCAICNWPSVGSVSSTHSRLPTQPVSMARSTPRMKSSSSTLQMIEKPRWGSSPVWAVRSSCVAKATRALARPLFMSQAPRP